MHVLYNATKRASEEIEKELNVEYRDLNALLAESDFVSLHVPLNSETRGLLDAPKFFRMKPTAFVINTARGPVIDEAALVAALRSGRIGHAALDVFVEEPLPPGNPFVALPNVTLTAHSAFRTPEASENLIRRALDIAKRLAE